MLPANWLKSHFFKNWNHVARSSTWWRYLPTGLQRDDEMKSRAKKMKDGPTTTGGHLSSYAGYGHSARKRAINDSAGWTILVNSGCSPFFFSFLSDSDTKPFLRIQSDYRWRCRCHENSRSKDMTAASFVSKQPLSSRARGGMGWEGRVGAKNTSDRIWSPLLRLENSDVRQEDVQHQCHCGTSAGKEEGETQESGCVCGFQKNLIKNRGWGGGCSVYGYALLNKRLNLSGAGYPPGTPSQSISSGS